MQAGADTVILPVSKVSLGFVSGGGEYGKGESILRRKENVEFVDDIRHPFAGTSAAGMSITPTAFLVVNNGNVRVIPAQYDNTIDRVLEMVPRTIDEVAKIVNTRSKLTAQPVPAPHSVSAEEVLPS